MDKPNIMEYDGTNQTLEHISKTLYGTYTETNNGTIVVCQSGKIHFYWHQHSTYSYSKVSRYFEVWIGQIIVQYGNNIPHIFNSMKEVEKFINEED